ncbi:bifunctional Actin family/ATPase [Babesia duncani]|uniref:Bifunctional Actin family/ATPase n=1 Tax=Babesia duncani TaxID=323732 RepID=A0AAD9PIE0_9APIC|nr:bifunctional Actin family/ATPase [Babesia duncani]
MADECLPIVFDTGSFATKVGFAGADLPKSVIPTVVGYYTEQGKHHIAIGKEALDESQTYSCLYPIQHGIVRNWALAEKIWLHVYQNELKITPEEHPLLLSEPPLNPKLHRERCCQMFFETFNVPALYMAPTAILSLYGTARTTGLILDIGNNVTHSVPIHEGTILPYGICRLDIGGFDLTSNLIRFVDDLKRNTIEDRCIARTIKEKLCYVSIEYNEEYKRMSENPQDYTEQYELPDGRIVNLCTEKIATAEMLFNPEIAGRTCPNIVSMTFHSIKTCEPELHRLLEYRQQVINEICQLGLEVQL